MPKLSKLMDWLLGVRAVGAFATSAALTADAWLPVDPAAVLAEAGARNVQVVVTDDPALTCAAHVGGGCFRTATPNTVYIATSLHGSALRYVALHEYTHVQQHAAPALSTSARPTGWRSMPVPIRPRRTTCRTAR